MGLSSLALGLLRNLEEESKITQLRSYFNLTVNLTLDSALFIRFTDYCTRRFSADSLPLFGTTS